MSQTPILQFRGEYRFLSNFYPSEIEVQGLTFPTVEHAYQAAKTEDPKWVATIATAPSPGEAKRLGQRAPLRENWDAIRDDVMLSLVRLKFRIPVLAQQLLGTGTRRLVEGNTWGDDYWGAVSAAGNDAGGVLYVGENRLGEILMRVRSELLWAVEPDHVKIEEAR